MENTSEISVIVIGAGLGGLAAALGLAIAGHSVTLLEQASILSEVGAGIQIPPNSSKILIEWGLRDQMEQHSLKPKSVIFRSYKDGKILSNQPLNPFTTDKYGFPYWHIHRADFHKVLAKAVKEHGVNILLNQKVAKFDTETNTITTTNGDQYSADLIIGADGFKSTTRSIFGDLPPYNTGEMAYRILIQTETLKNDPELKKITDEANLNFWLGPHKHSVVYLLQQGEQCNVVIIGPDNLPDNVMVQEANVKEMKKLFQDWDPFFQHLISHAQHTTKWKLQDSKELDTWVYPTANIALLGDACHATLPCLAQGAAQAVEDAAVLSTLLSNNPKKEDIHGLLQKYETLRKPRTTTIVKESAKLKDDVFHLPDGELQRERDYQLINFSPQDGCSNRWADPAFQKYLFSYNAFSEASE